MPKNVTMQFTTYKHKTLSWGIMYHSLGSYAEKLTNELILIIKLLNLN